MLSHRRRCALALALALVASGLACDESGGGGGTVDATTGGGGTGEGVEGESDGAPAASSDAGDATGGSEFLEACEPGPTPTLEIGGGTARFEPWVNDEAVLVYGHQGGYHIDVSLLATRLTREGAIDGVLRGYIDGALRAETSYGGELTCLLSGEGLESAGNLLIWEAEPAELHMRLARIEAELTDAAGTTVSASAEVVIIDPFAS
ncbi:MAG: hypothetical protein H6713_00505 [Myxococcales bacterium]|nr:hypothetical protein [Myxococcales bacterium]MCB9748462.1 hypothetical protein [Myxococcales bacterium]